MQKTPWFIICKLIAKMNNLSSSYLRKASCSFKMALVVLFMAPAISFGAEIKTIKIDSRPYAYELIKSANSVATILVMTGGPGETLIGEKPSAYGSLPVDIIQTDYRGLGYNSYENETLPFDFFTSEKIASDLVQVILNEGVDKKWILYGVSYGTVIATILSSKLEQLKIYPYLVLLNSQVGQASTGNKYYQNFSRKWEAVRESLDPKARQAMNSMHGAKPFGYHYFAQFG